MRIDEAKHMRSDCEQKVNIDSITSNTARWMGQTLFHHLKDAQIPGNLVQLELLMLGLGSHNLALTLGVCIKGWEISTLHADMLLFTAKHDPF